MCWLTVTVLNHATLATQSEPGPSLLMAGHLEWPSTTSLLAKIDLPELGRFYEFKAKWLTVAIGLIGVEDILRLEVDKHLFVVESRLTRLGVIADKCIPLTGIGIDLA